MVPLPADTEIDHAAVFDATPTACIVLDRDFVIVEVNRAFCRQVGRRRDELLGRPLLDAFPANPADPDGRGVDVLRASLERARDTGARQQMDVQQYDVEDPETGAFVERHWRAENIPVLDDEGRLRFILHRTEEVTDVVREHAARTEAESDLVVRARQLEEANRLLRDARDRERHVALALQRSMLPVPPADLPGVAIAARYRPAEDALFVGGDFYDVVPLSEDSVALAVGDVVGKGLAAAAVMGQLRSALSAATHGADGPPEALDTLDRYARTIEGTLGTTVVQVRFDRSRGTVRWARAGHVPPLLVTPEGEARFLTEAGSPPLGVGDPDTPHAKAEAPFPAGTTLVLYTDGLVERRGRSISVGLDALVDAVRRFRHLDVEPLADAVLDALREDGPAPDDTALLVARGTP